MWIQFSVEMISVLSDLLVYVSLDITVVVCKWKQLCMVRHNWIYVCVQIGLRRDILFFVSIVKIFFYFFIIIFGFVFFFFLNIYLMSTFL